MFIELSTIKFAPCFTLRNARDLEMLTSRPRRYCNIPENTDTSTPDMRAFRPTGNAQFFVGTEVQYLPLSFVRDTCGVKVDCKDDVHSKQRLGDIPKPLRWGASLQS